MPQNLKGNRDDVQQQSLPFVRMNTATHYFFTVVVMRLGNPPNILFYSGGCDTNRLGTYSATRNSGVLLKPALYTKNIIIYGVTSLVKEILSTS